MCLPLGGAFCSQKEQYLHSGSKTVGNSSNESIVVSTVIALYMLPSVFNKLQAISNRYAAQLKDSSVSDLRYSACKLLKVIKPIRIRVMTRPTRSPMSKGSILLDLIAWRVEKPSFNMCFLFEMKGETCRRYW